MSTTNNHCTLYLVRHGETEWNVRGVVMGQSDSPLTEKGIEQAERFADLFEKRQFDAIFSSDSGRTKKTAEIIKGNRPTPIILSPLLRECSFGHFESKPVTELQKALAERSKIREKISEEELWSFRLADDIETQEEVFQRFLSKLKEISLHHTDKTVLVVTHGGPIRFLLAKLGYAKMKDLRGGSFKNGGWVKLQSDGNNFALIEVEGVTRLTQ